MAVVLSFGVVFWLHGLHAAGVIDTDIWAGGFPHWVRDGLLALPLALVSTAGGIWLAQCCEIRAPSAVGRFGEAALVAVLFATLLVPAAAPHQYLDRFFDGALHAHAFHGQSRAEVADRAGGLTPVGLQALRDAFLGYIAALPLVFLSLVAQSGGEPNSRRASPTRARCIMPAAIALWLLAASGAALNVGAGAALHGQGVSAHARFVTGVTIGAGIDADDLRVAVQSAKWVRQSAPPEPNGDAAADSDRVYLEVTLENLGASPRSIRRADFRVLAKDGMSWGPLADNFPVILLEPGEKLTTWLVFELPPQAAHLDLVSTAANEARIPIADDTLGELFRALCRALAGP
jgi:hypothetical protein